MDLQYYVRKRLYVVLNWDLFCKHTSHTQTKKYLGSMKKREWYYTKNYKHAKDHYKFVTQSHQTIAQEVASGATKKVV